MARPPEKLRAFLRSSSAAYFATRKAEKTLREHAGSDPSKTERTALRRLEGAMGAIQAAFNDLAPSGGRRGRVLNNAKLVERGEPLYRCLLCQALVWESDCRGHLELVEMVKVLGLTIQHLGIWFQLAPSRDEVGEDEADEERGF